MKARKRSYHVDDEDDLKRSIGGSDQVEVARTQRGVLQADARLKRRLHQRQLVH